MIGPNCPGVLSPGKANVGIIPAEIFSRGHDRPRLALRHAHVPDRPRARRSSGSATRRSSGSAAIRSSARRFIDVLAAVRGRSRDRADRPRRRDRRRRGGEGGPLRRGARDEARASPTSPASPAPPGKTMGHAGAIISGLVGHGAGEEGSARKQRHPGRDDADRGRAARGRALRRART